MDILINDFIAQIRFGEVQNHLNMQVIPLFSEQKETITYLTLKEALEKRLLTIREISRGGSVPELKVINMADVPVLLLDGEELAGAKQNRILNTTILVNARAEVIIPVSCTEQGRWSYRTEEFYDSGTVSHSSLRADKVSSVTISLKNSGTFRSNQSEVWENVDRLSRAANVQSSTGAMRDVFEGKRETLEDYLKDFRYVPNQKGIFVLVDGEIAGWDILSRAAAFENLYKKLIKSYAMDALIKNEKKITLSRYPIEEARRFLEEILYCQVKKYPSTGLGEDYRFEGPGKVGSALVVEKQVIHMAFFKVGQDEKIDPMSGYGDRRRYRI